MTTQESKDPGEFWGKVLSASKVKRVLRKRGFDPEAFRRDYEADTSRGPRGPKRPSKTEMDAVGAFQKTGDFDALNSFEFLLGLDVIGDFDDCAGFAAFA